MPRPCEDAAVRCLNHSLDESRARYAEFRPARPSCGPWAGRRSTPLLACFVEPPHVSWPCVSHRAPSEDPALGSSMCRFSSLDGRCGWVQLLPRGKLSTTWCLGPGSPFQLQLALSSDGAVQWACDHWKLRSWEVLANNPDASAFCCYGWGDRLRAHVSASCLKVIDMSFSDHRHLCHFKEHEHHP